MVPAPSLSPI